MRITHQLLLALLVISGLQACTWADFAHQPISYSHSHGHDHTGHDHDHPEPCDSSHDDDSPQDHHQHQCHFCVTGGLHWIDAKDSSILPCSGMSQFLRIRHESQAAPDAPFLNEDKPPLI